VICITQKIKHHYASLYGVEFNPVINLQRTVTENGTQGNWSFNVKRI